jgi:hypothetical protein
MGAWDLRTAMAGAVCWISIGLLGCTSGAGRMAGPAGVGSPAAGQPAIPQYVALPPLSELDALAAARGLGHGGGLSKAPSWWLEDAWNTLVSWVTGAQAVATSPGAVAVGETLELTPNPGDPRPSFAVYGVPADTNTSMVSVGLLSDKGAGFISDDGAGLVTDLGGQFLSDDGAGFANNRVYALANFSTGRWEFADGSEEGLVDLSPFGSIADLTSPSGFLFIAPLAHNPVRITGVSPLGRRPGDNTPAPDLASFTGTAVRGGINFAWNDLGPGPLVVKVYLGHHPFASIDEASVSFSYPAANRETLFTSSLHQPLYFRALVHHIFSGRDSALTGLQVVAELPGDALEITLDANPAEAEPGSPVTLTATGADSYDWDIDGNGTFDVFGDATGTQQLPDGAPGPASVRVKGHQGADGLAVRSIYVMRRGWITYTLDADNDTGGYIQLLRLADGRLATAYNHSNQGVRYATSDSANPLTATEWSVVDLPLPAGQAGIGHDLAMVNARPAVAVNTWSDYDLWYCYASTPDGANGADWAGVQVSTAAGTGVGEGVALAEVGGRPAISYITEFPDGSTPDPTDTCMGLGFMRALNAVGDDWPVFATEVDSKNLTPGFAYFGLDCDMEVIAGFPAVIYCRANPGPTPGTNTVVYAWNSAADGTGTWSLDVVNASASTRRGSLIDCGGVPGFSLWSGSHALFDAGFYYGAGSTAGGPGNPWQVTNIVTGGWNSSSQSVVYHQGKPWMVGRQEGFSSDGLYLYEGADGTGSSLWTRETVLLGIGVAAADVVLEGGKPVIGFVYPGFNVNTKIAIRY